MSFRLAWTDDFHINDLLPTGWDFDTQRKHQAYRKRFHRFSCFDCAEATFSLNAGNSMFWIAPAVGAGYLSMENSLSGRASTLHIAPGIMVLLMEDAAATGQLGDDEAGIRFPARMPGLGDDFLDSHTSSSYVPYVKR